MSEDLLTQKLFDEIVEMEKSERRWLSPKSIIKTTKEVATKGKEKYGLSDKPFVIRRNIKLDLFLWIAMTCIILGPMTYGIIEEFRSSNSNILGVTFLSLFVILFLFVGYKNLTLKALTSPITFTTQELTINDKTFTWFEIQETFCVLRFAGRTRRTSFVIGLKNGVIHFFDIDNQLGFKYSERDFSKFVEHYKHFTSPNK
ncbi:MAG: hypothetical protein ABIN97_20620 [Ginsengibacter sp.]